MRTNYILTLAVLLFFTSLCMANSPKTYKSDDEGFIRDWLLAGPFPNEPTTVGKPLGFDRDFLKVIGGEAKAEPFAGLVMKKVLFFADKAKLIAKVGATNIWGFTESKTIDVAWRELHWNKKSPIIKLDNLHPDFRDYHVSYLAAYVKSYRRRTVNIRLGSDDGFKLWVNGELLGQVSVSRSAKIDENEFQTVLEKGVNRILLKVSEQNGSHGAVLRILDHHSKPLKGLEVVLALPIRRLIAICENLDSVNIRDGEIFGYAALGKEICFVGKNTLSVKLASEKPITAAMEMQLKNPAGKSVWRQKVKKKLDIKRAVAFIGQVNLSQEGKYTLSIRATDEAGKVICKASRNFNVQGPVSLQAKHKELTSRTGQLNAQLAEKGKQLSDLQKQVKAIRGSITGQYLRMENIYALNHKKLIKSYGPKAKSIDKPFNSASIRSSLCLNGDTWQIAPAKSTGRMSIDESYIPTKGWEAISVPTFGCEYYYRNTYWPMKVGKLRYAPATKALDTEKAGDFRINPGRENNAMYLRTQFTLPKGWNSNRVFLCSETANYKIKVWVNGKLVGEHKGGWTDPLNMDISGHLKPGQNELMVFAGRKWLYGNRGKTLDRLWGLIGDVYLKSKPKVYVSDTWIIPRWRKATIETLTYITNTTKRTVTVKMLQQAVLSSRVKLDCEEKTVRLGPGATFEVRGERPWSDPQLWGIGGKYGRPVLYDMVTTLKEAKGKDTKVIDQHFQRFGYREFWKTRFDFFLNGKRIFLQGVVMSASPSNMWPRQFWTIYMTLLRNECNINMIRPHWEMHQGRLARYCDEAGMLLMGQMYPILGENMSLEMWKSSRMHQHNLDTYRAWVKWLRNHPSVVVYNTDNEVFTQYLPIPSRIPTLLQNDKKAALYGQYVKSLDPTRIVTRSGDQGTWGKLGAWREDPPAEVANYHYPDYSMSKHIINWQSTYEKPLLSGETNYCGYGYGRGWVGAIPKQVAKIASRLQHVLTIYRDLEVPGWVGMGIGHDGFVELKDGGTPFGFSFSQSGDLKSRKTPILTTGQKKKFPAFPYYRLRWPAQSGPGIKANFFKCFHPIYGSYNINWYHPDYPTTVLNACNRSYKKYTHPMPPLGNKRTAEVIYHISKDGKPVSEAMVFLTPAGEQATEPIGVRADKAGLAWFLIPRVGNYTLSVAGTTFSRKVSIKPLHNDMKAGFNYVPHVKIDLTERKASK